MKKLSLLLGPIPYEWMQVARLSSTLKIDQLHASATLSPENEPQIPTEKEARWAPEQVGT